MPEQTDGSVAIAPEEPVTIIRHPDTGQVVQVVYGDMERMMRGEPTIIWSEEIIRDDKGQVVAIQTMRPNGVVTIEHLDRDSNGKLIGTRLEYL
jgi:hypothetical protein